MVAKMRPLLWNSGPTQFVIRRSSLICWIPDKFSGGIHVSKPPASFDPRQAIGEALSIIELRVNDELAGGVRIAPVARLFDGRQSLREWQRIIKLRINDKFSSVINEPPVL